MAMLENWQELWRRVGATGDGAGVFHDLLGRYAEAHRHYHTLQHLQECLGQRDLIRAVARRPDEVELALWFHDAVYELRATDNERRSAELASTILAAAAVAPEVRARIAALIMATTRAAPPESVDAAAILDVDLISLAAEPERFDQCEDQLRAERPWLPDDDYWTGRRAALRRFLAQARLFETAPFRDACEARARRNLVRMLERIERRGVAADDEQAAAAAAVLRRLPFFGNCTTELLQRLARRSRHVACAPGDQVIREGDHAATEIYVLIEGELAVESKGRLIMTLDRPGDVAGELAVLHAPPRTADVFARAPATLLAIRPETLSLPEFADLAGIFYMMLAHSLARKLRAQVARSREMLDEATREATTDRLTGLANRKRLDDVLQDYREEADAGGAPFALVMLDVDHFKQYNDEHGHLMGDQVLSKIAMVLQAHLRPGDLAARYGGEEFVVVLRDCDEAAAAALAGKLRRAIEREGVAAPGPEVDRLSATFGVATYERGLGTDELIRRADACLYRGKAQGRNRVVTMRDALRQS